MGFPVVPVVESARTRLRPGWGAAQWVRETRPEPMRIPGVVCSGYVRIK